MGLSTGERSEVALAPGAYVRVVASIRRERLPRPGLTPHPWAWQDVLDSPPPARGRRREEGSFVVRHGFDPGHEDVDSRIGYATVVQADRSGAVRVDERVHVEPRVLSGVLRAEHAMHRRVDATTRAGKRLASWGGRVASRHQKGRPAHFLAWLVIVLGQGVAWLSRLFADALHAVVEAPDRLWASAASADAHLSRRRERRALLEGLFDPYELSREGKAAALFVVGAGVALGLLAAHLVMTLAWPEHAPAWRALLGFFLMGIASTVAFPFFPELRLHEVADAVGGFSVGGPLLAILTIATAMTIGGWIVLFLGDEIHSGIRRSVRPGSQLARLLDRAEAFASRHGFWTALLVLAIPMGPDTPVYYVLATVRTPARAYLAGAFLGTFTRFSLFYFVPVWYGALTGLFG